MKENRDLYYIAALADGEIKDPSQEQKLRDEIRNNPDLQFEYFVQTSIKNLVSTRLKIAPAPVKVRQRLERKISPKSEKSLTSRLIPEIYFRKPAAFAWGGTLVVILAVVLTLLNLPRVPGYKNFAIEQSGSSNMYIQARHNFENILAGKLAPQFSSDSSEEIRQFFTEQGVAYKTYVPEIKNWKLIGAVVSNDHGEKFAHHVYSTPDGKLVYLFQVDEADIKKKHFLTLTNDLLTYLDSGKCYESTEGSFVTLFTKVKENIFAVVSNGSPDEIENNLCQLN
jgi:hypothetical protein